MKVGFSRKCITPDGPQPLAGYGDTLLRWHEQVIDDIMTTCVAITDEQDQTVLLIGNDLLYLIDPTIIRIRKAIEEKLGVPGTHVMIAATHTHSAPDPYSPHVPEVKRYYDFMADVAVQAAEEAMADRKPARMLLGDIEVEGLNFVRHYTTVDTETGELGYLGDNFGEGPTKRITGHATPVDQTMHLVKFEREGDKDVVIANWRAHGTMTGGYSKKDLSSDYIGPFREVLEAQQDCHVLYLQGAAGNVNPKSRIPEENYSLDHRVMGARLAYFAVKGLEKVQPVADGTIKAKRLVYDCPINHEMDCAADAVKEMLRRWNETHEFEYAMEPGRPYGIRSIYQAIAVDLRCAKPATMDVELNAIAIGDALAIITAPDELFDTNTVYVEEHAPYQTVLSMCYCNGRRGYIPSQIAFDYTCYESDCCDCAPGSGEKIADNFLQMLQELKGDTK